MTFEELWERIWEEAHLPSGAKELIPQSLSHRTKDKLLKSKKNPHDIATIIEDAVTTINKGSVESLDSIVSKKL